MRFLRAVRDRFLRLPWRELAGPLCITILVFIYYRRLLTGSFPVSHDHPAHLFNAWLTSDVLLPAGHVSGFSDLWFAGYPANDLYGPGGSLWVTLFRYLTFGLLDYGTTYGLAIFGLMLLVPMSAYVLGRAFLGRTAGFVGGMLLVMTKGGWYDLGWFWILEMGVWPFALGAAFSFIALAVTRRYLRRGGPAALAAAAVAVAAAIVGHPMSLLVVGIAGPILVVYHLLEFGRAGVTRLFVRTALAIGLAVCLCGAWLIPFLTKSAYTQKLGETWMELYDAFPVVAQLNLFGPEWRLVLGLAVVGVLIAVVRRNFAALTLATCGAAMILLASTDVLYHLRLFDVASPLAGIQYPRFVGVVRVFSYLLAGYAIRELVGFASTLAGRTVVTSWRERLRVGVAVSLPLLLCLPFAPHLISYFRESHLPKAESVYTQRDMGWWPYFRQAADWLRDNADGEPWSRVGAFGNPYDHVFSTLPVWSGLPVYTGGYVPAHTYRFFFDGHRDAKTLRAVGVRFVLAMGDFGEKHPEAKHRETFGPIKIFELATAAPRRITGSCNVEEVTVNDEEMVADVTGTNGPCRIRFHRSDFPNWQATFDGEPLDIERTGAFRGSRYAAFMSVLVPGDGRVAIRWESTRGDIAGMVFSAFGLLVLLGLGVAAWRPSWFAFLDRLVPVPGSRMRVWASRSVWATTALVVVIALAVAIARAQEVAAVEANAARAVRARDVGNHLLVVDGNLFHVAGTCDAARRRRRELEDLDGAKRLAVFGFGVLLAEVAHREDEADAHGAQGLRVAVPVEEEAVGVRRHVAAGVDGEAGPDGECREDVVVGVAERADTAPRLAVGVVPQPVGGLAEVGPPAHVALRVDALGLGQVALTKVADEVRREGQAEQERQAHRDADPEALAPARDDGASGKR